MTRGGLYFVFRKNAFFSPSEFVLAAVCFLHILSESPQTLVPEGSSCCSASLEGECVRAWPSCPPSIPGRLLALHLELLADLRKGPRAASQLWSLEPVPQGRDTASWAATEFSCKKLEVFEPEDCGSRVPVPSAHVFGRGLRHPHMGVHKCLFPSSTFWWVLVASAVGLLGSWPGFASQAWVATVLELMGWASSSREAEASSRGTNRA